MIAGILSAIWLVVWLGIAILTYPENWDPLATEQGSNPGPTALAVVAGIGPIGALVCVAASPTRGRRRGAAVLVVLTAMAWLAFALANEG